MAELAIVTLSRTPAYLERLSDALAFQHGAPDCEKLLIANADSDAMRRVARQGGWSGISPGYNTTFSEGCNLGAENTTAPWLLMLNDDVVPYMNFLAALWDQRTDAEIVGSLLIHKDGTVNHAGTAVWASTCRTDHLGRGDGRERWDHEFAYTPSCTFAAALINRHLWNELQGLDEAYCYGWEDTDFCLRALEMGARVGVARRAAAEHEECGTRPRGGSNDVSNFQFFKQRWQSRLAQILKDYCTRHPGVQGAYV